MSSDSARGYSSDSEGTQEAAANSSLLDLLSLSSLAEIVETREVWTSAPNAARAVAHRRVLAGDDVSEAFALAAVAANIDALVWLTRHGPDVNRRTQRRLAAAGGGVLWKAAPSSAAALASFSRCGGSSASGCALGPPLAATPLMLASCLPDEGDAIRTVDTLLSLGADVGAVDTYALRTALHLAEHTSVISRLLDAGARPDVVAEDGLTPIGVAWSCARLGVLQEYKRRFNYYTHRSLRAAVELHDFKTVRDLIDDGERLDLKDWPTRVSVGLLLAHAVCEGRRDVLERLLAQDVSQNGADFARSGAGLVNSLIWIASAAAAMPLLHVAAYAGEGACFTDLSPPPPDAGSGGAVGIARGRGNNGGGGGQRFERGFSSSPRRGGGDAGGGRDHRGEGSGSSSGGVSGMFDSGSGGGPPGSGGGTRLSRALEAHSQQQAQVKYRGADEFGDYSSGGGGGSYSTPLQSRGGGSRLARALAESTAAAAAGGGGGLDSPARHPRQQQHYRDNDAEYEHDDDDDGDGAYDVGARRSRSTAGGDRREHRRSPSPSSRHRQQQRRSVSPRRRPGSSSSDGGDGEYSGGGGGNAYGREYERGGGRQLQSVNEEDSGGGDHEGRRRRPARGASHRSSRTRRGGGGDYNDGVYAAGDDSFVDERSSDNCASGDDDDEGGSSSPESETEAQASRRKYRSLVRLLLDAGARIDTTITWNVPALPASHREGSGGRGGGSSAYGGGGHTPSGGLGGRYGDDSDSDSDNGGGGTRRRSSRKKTQRAAADAAAAAAAAALTGVRGVSLCLPHASALHIAAFFGRAGFVAEWLAAGGPLEGHAALSVSTALQVAELERREGVVGLLRRAGADAYPRSAEWLRTEQLLQLQMGAMFAGSGGSGALPTSSQSGAAAESGIGVSAAAVVDPRAETLALLRCAASPAKAALAARGGSSATPSGGGMLLHATRGNRDSAAATSLLPEYSAVLDAVAALNGDAVIDAILRGQSFNPQRDDALRATCAALLGNAIAAYRIDIVMALLALDRAQNGVRQSRGGGGLVNVRFALARPDCGSSGGGGADSGGDGGGVLVTRRDSAYARRGGNAHVASSAAAAAPLASPSTPAVLTTALHALAEMSYDKARGGMKEGQRARHEAMVGEVLRARPNPRALAEPARAREAAYSHAPGLTPLHLFAAHDDAPSIRIWAEAGCPIELDLGGVGTPLHLAVRCGNVAAARALINAGADVHAVAGGVTAGGGAPSPVFHRLVEFAAAVDARTDGVAVAAAAARASASAAAASSSGGDSGSGGAAAPGLGILDPDEVESAQRSVRAAGHRRIVLLARLLHRSGAVLNARSLIGHTVLGDILSHAVREWGIDFVHAGLFYFCMPLSLEERRGAWTLSPGDPLFQVRVTPGAVAAFATSALLSRAGGGALSKLKDFGGGGGTVASVVDADSVTMGATTATHMTHLASTVAGGGGGGGDAGSSALVGLSSGFVEVGAGCGVVNPPGGGGGRGAHSSSSDDRDDAELLRELGTDEGSGSEQSAAPPVLQSLAIELLKYGTSVDTWSEALQRSLLQLEEDPDSIPVRCSGHDALAMV